MPSQEFETEPQEPEWFPPDKPKGPLTTVVDGAGDSSFQPMPGVGDIRPMTGVVQPPERKLIYLDPDDPFDRALIPIVEVSHRKRADYATDGSPFDNFRITAEFAGFEGGWVSALFNVQQKLARVQALRANGRAGNPQNEALDDTILDAATYGILALAIWLEEKAAASG